MSERHPLPVIIHSKDKHQILRRLPLDKPPFSEGEIQELLRIHPEILPISLLGDDRFEPLICIGREIGVGKGCVVDNLYVSPQGYITVVETKLWKNQEARREVVAQIIEYAKQLSHWTYEDLDRAFKTYLEKYEKKQAKLFEWVNEQTEEPIEEMEFIDAVSRGLRDGSFKLLIVGEGIRENAEEMVEYLHDTPHLRFNLALVELACYAMDEKGDTPILIVPRVIAKTTELNRAVVTIRMSDELREKVSIEVDTPAEPVKPGARPQPLEESEFYLKLGERIGKEKADQVEEFVTQLTEELDLETAPRTVNLVLKFRSPTDDHPIALIGPSIKGKMTLFGGLPHKLSDHGLDPQFAYEFILGMNQIHSGFRVPTENEKATGKISNTSVDIGQIVDKLPAIKAAIQIFLERVNQ